MNVHSDLISRPNMKTCAAIIVTIRQISPKENNK